MWKARLQHWNDDLFKHGRQLAGYARSTQYQAVIQVQREADRAADGVGQNVGADRQHRLRHIGRVGGKPAFSTPTRHMPARLGVFVQFNVCRQRERARGQVVDRRSKPAVNQQNVARFAGLSDLVAKQG